MEITKPIFIVGTGRCGSTAFHQLLGLHPRVMWLSGFAEEFPRRPSWNRWAVTAMGNPVLRGMFGAMIKPGENYGFWYTHAYGFAEPGRDLLRSDVTPRVRKQVRAVLEQMLSPEAQPNAHQADRVVTDRLPERDFRRTRSSFTSSAMAERWPVRCCMSPGGNGADGTGHPAGATARCRRKIRQRGKPAGARSSRWRGSSGESTPAP